MCSSDGSFVVTVASFSLFGSSPPPPPAQVTLECLGTSCPLFMVTGSCHGLEVTLDSNHVPFGAVVQDSQSTRRILMINTGEIGTG